MKEIWDKRYSEEGFAYGIEPNEFFARELRNLNPGKLLLPAEGEGRNAVFAAQLGWDVTAFDFSKVAQKKALELADHYGVEIKYFEADYSTFSANMASFDCIGLVYAHIMDGNRTNYHQKLLNYLKPEGTIILEAFSKEQIGNNTGGPPKIEFLYSKEELSTDFSHLQNLAISTHRIELNEGKFHNGVSDIIRLKGTL
jgi:SAM-dependent methyltransferase